MLVPITRKTFEDLVPPFSTAAQYRYCWGGLTDVVRRLLFSLVAVLVAVAVELVVNETIGFFVFILGAIATIYWLWGPIVLATQRNRVLRRYSFAGLYRGEILDRYVREEVVNTKEQVDKHGNLVVKRDRKAILHIEIGDRQGVLTEIRIPFQRNYRPLRPGDEVELLVASNRADLSRIGMISDVYVPDHKIWLGDYPYIQRDLFVQVRQQLDQPRRSPPERQRYRDDYGDRNANNRYLNGRYGDNRDVEDRYLEAPYPDERYAEDRYLDAPYPHDAPPDSRMPRDRRQLKPGTRRDRP